MSVSGKNSQWEFYHSLWIGWTFTFLLCFVSFLWIGIAAKQNKWVYVALAYLATLIFFGIPTGGLAVVLIGLISMWHAFVVRREYLILKAAQEDAERDKIRTQVRQNPQDLSYPPPRPRAAPVAPPRPIPDPIPEPTLALPVDINTASEQEIAALPGMTIVLAKRVQRYRETRGGFSSVRELGEALGLQPHIVERLKSRVIFSQRPHGDGERQPVDY